MKEKLKKWLPSRRKLMQLYFALLFNVNFHGFKSGNIYQGSTKVFCVPGINCYSCPGAVGACPLGSLQGSFSAGRSTIYYVCGILVLYCVLFGRMICGWLCPFGLIQELLHKIPTPKLKKSPVTRLLSWFKYVVLVFFVLIVPITYAFRDTPLPAFCKYICPAGTLEGGLMLLANKVNASYFSMLGPLFTWKFLVLVSVVVGSIFIFRVFCRFLCPLGALYGLFNRISIFGIRVDDSKCTNCGLCVSKCKMDIRHVGDMECISCGECAEVCPTKAIVWKGSGILLKKNEIPEKSGKKRLAIRVAIWAILLGILVGAAALYWHESSNKVYATEGNAIGDLCYGYDLQRINAEGILDQTVNPTATGTAVTVINFWGTWCTPCVNELPYFDRIAEEYAGEVTVIAIHTSMIHETAPAFLAEYYPDSAILFAKDDTLNGMEAYYTSLGGRGTYPYTLVLDENGIITHVFFEALEYEDLKTAVEENLS